MVLKLKGFQFFINLKMQLKTIVLSCIFFSQAILCLSQGLNNFWILGYGSSNTVLNFDSVYPYTHLQQMDLPFRESNASISSIDGKLLFYTNGVKIKNSLAQTMLNGDSLNPGWYVNAWKNNGLRIGQGLLIIPFPSDSNKYYLFHETLEIVNSTYQPLELFYSTIDMTLDSGKGAVFQKNISILNDTLIGGEITACKHANGRDWWVVTHRYLSNLFYILLITPNGIQGPFTQNIGGVFTYGGGGQSCFSPDGKKFARFYNIDGLDVFDFDRCTGVFSNWQHTDSVSGFGGVAFSPNSQLLYVTAETNIYQFNLADTSQSLTDLKYLVAQWDTFYSPGPPFATTFYLAQLAPDGRIYINSTNGVQHLHYINFPDSIGTACDVCQHCILLPTYNAFTMPNHPNYFLGADSGSVCDSLMLSNSQPLESNKLTSIVSVYPNPVQNYFDINYKIQPFEIAQFIVYNLIGKEKYRIKLIGNNSSKRVFTNDFENGIYFYKFKNQSGKFIILK